MVTQVRTAKPKPTSAVRGKHLIQSLALGAIFLGIYLSTITGNHTEAEDAVRYGLDVRSADPRLLSHPNHLMYAWLGLGLYRLLHLFGLSLDPLTTLQVIDVLAGAFGVGLLFHILRGSLGASAALGATLLMAFSYGYWWYSVEAEVYLLSTVFTIGTFALAYASLSDSRARTYLLLGGVHGLAMLAHLSNALFATVVVAVIFLGLRRLGWRLSLQNLALYTVAVALTVSIPYLAAIVLAMNLHSVEAVYEWVGYYILTGGSGGLTRTTIVNAAVGISRQTIGGHYVFAIPAIADLANQGLRDKSLIEETLIARNIDGNVALVLALLHVVIAGIFTWLAVIGVQLRRDIWRRYSQLLVLLLVWLVSYVLFFTWYEPLNIEFWIVSLVPVPIILATVIAAGEGNPSRPLPARVLFPVAIVLLAATNFLGSISPQSSSASDLWWQKSRWYATNTTSQDLIVTAGPYVWKNYLGYFTPAQIYSVGMELLRQPGELDEVLRQLDKVVNEVRSRGGMVYFARDALESDDAVDAIRNPWREKERSRLRSIYGSRLSPRPDTGDDTAFVLE